MKRSSVDVKALIVLGVFSIALVAYVIAGVVEGHADEPSTPVNQIMECSDYVMPQAITAADRALAVTARMVGEARQSEPYYDETEYEYQESDYAAYSGSGGYDMPYSELYGEHGPVPGMPGWYDGNVETIYEASGHYLASEWTLDSDGFYHDSEGRYVIGVSIDATNPDTGEGYKYGDVVQTGKGEAVVYDYGQGVNNVHDFATSGW